MQDEGVRNDAGVAAEGRAICEAAASKSAWLWAVTLAAMGGCAVLFMMTLPHLFAGGSVLLAAIVSGGLFALGGVFASTLRGAGRSDSVTKLSVSFGLLDFVLLAPSLVISATVLPSLLAGATWASFAVATLVAAVLLLASLSAVAGARLAENGTRKIPLFKAGTVQVEATVEAKGRRTEAS